MYTTEQIKSLRCRASAARLSYYVDFDEESDERLAQVCNGIGADWMSERSRKVVTKAMKYMEASAMIHDWEYDAQIDTQENADERLLLNGLREVRFMYPQWYNWRRWLGERAVLAAFEVLSRTGKVAWALAYYNKNHKGKI